MHSICMEQSTNLIHVYKMKLVIKASQGNDYFSNKVDTGNVMEQETEELQMYSTSIS